MDGVLAMDKQGPVGGRAFEAEKILMSEDPLALDAAAVEMIGLHMGSLPVYAASAQQGIGEWRMGSIEVCGDFTASPKLAGFIVPKAMGESGRGGGAMKVIVDLMKTRPEMDLAKCRQCNVCVASCPVQAIDKETKKSTTTSALSVCAATSSASTRRSASLRQTGWCGFYPA